jgi:hypothetical protein
MIYTARQLEDLLKTHGRVVLPYRARLTPLAKDWAKLKKIAIGYSDTDSAVAQALGLQPAGPMVERKPLLWWSDGASGIAKAALMSVAREANFTAISANDVVATIKQIAAAVKSATADGAVIVTQNAAKPLLLANRIPSLRAFLGTTQTALEQAIHDIAPNVLVIEDQRLTMQQIRNMIQRFAKASRQPNENLDRQLKELAS